MTFGKVVVGPDVLDVGHLLTTTGNVTFDPDHPETAVQAVERAIQLADEESVGPANQTLALQEWSAEQCANTYSKFFQSVPKATA